MKITFFFVIMIIIILLLFFHFICIYFFRLLGPCRWLSTTRIWCKDHSAIKHIYSSAIVIPRTHRKSSKDKNSLLCNNHYECIFYLHNTLICLNQPLLESPKFIFEYPIREFFSRRTMFFNMNYWICLHFLTWTWIIF